MGRHGAGGPKIEQHDPLAFGLPAEIGEVRIGLHIPEFKQLPQGQGDERRHDGIARLLWGGLQRLNRLAFDKVHRQHIFAGEFVDRGGQDEGRVVR